MSPRDSRLCPPGATDETHCIDTDADFDGVLYRKHVWPGSFRNPFFDALFYAEPVIFSSPLFRDRWGHRENFSRIAFETDMPRIEFATNPPCQRHLSNPSDLNPGAGCVNPPVGADFYPIFSTRAAHEEGDHQGDHEKCQWQEGGRVPTRNTGRFRRKLSAVERARGAGSSNA